MSEWPYFCRNSFGGADNSRSGADLSSIVSLFRLIVLSSLFMRILTGVVAVFLFVCFCSVSCLFPQSGPPAAQRETLVAYLAGQGITDTKVLAAMGKVPREVFVEPAYLDSAYRNTALPIGDGQTISQPLVVALMTQTLRLKGDERVLEVGTGSGYQAAVLAEIAREVYTIEIKDGLAKKAEERLARLGYGNVHVLVADGYGGLPQHAPFDAIVVTASAGKIPEPLLDQLSEGGRLIMPVGPDPYSQVLTLVEKKGGRLRTSLHGEVAFVRMTGEAETAR
jgi:protein-L-isoaspartate(D-aspartate) O-methyltransferase